MKTVDVDRFQNSQLAELLALPEGDEEKFIAEKAAEGTPVENMKIKNLRDEIKKYKASLEQSDHDHNMALVEIAKLQDTVQSLNEQIYNLERNYPVPNDYEALEKELEELRNRPIDVAIEIPADYESTKLELAELKNRELSFKQDYTLTYSPRINSGDSAIINQCL